MRRAWAWFGAAGVWLGGVHANAAPRDDAARARTPSASPAASARRHTPPQPATDKSARARHAKASNAAKASTQRARDAAYKKSVKAWHAAQPAPETVTHLVLLSVNSQERIELEAASADGGFSALDHERASWLLRERGSGKSHPVDPQLLDTLYQIQRHFGAPMLRVISGYRAPSGAKRSNHSRGRACDFVVPGATDKAVAEFSRHLGHRGVGIYPRSGFVHVDVRERSYFWIDNSGPGRKNRERGILGGVASHADQKARERGDRRPTPYGVHESGEPLPELEHEHTDDEDSE